MSKRYSKRNTYIQTTLPDYFDQWQTISFNIPELVKAKKIRDAVNQMSLLSSKELRGFREHHLAFNMLACISSAYVFQDGDHGVPRSIPNQLAKPLYDVSLYLGLKPHVCHPAFVQSNYRIIDEQRPIARSNMRTILNMPGGKQCEEFILCHAQIEIDAGPGIKAVLDGQGKVKRDDLNSLIEDLLVLVKCIKCMKKSLQILSDSVDANSFYKDIRPYLAGIGGEKYKYNNGLIFEGVNNDEPIKITGASAAQSCTLQCFDGALSIVHSGERGKFLDQMLEHVLPKHKQFIEYIRDGPNIRRYVEEKNNPMLTEIFQLCIENIRLFRSFHIQLVTKFIVSMADKYTEKDNFKSISEKGTGGQELMNFLKKVRNDTN